MQYNYDFLMTTRFGNFVRAFTGMNAEYWRIFAEENKHNPVIDGKVDGLTLNFFISYFDITYLPPDLARNFLSAIFSNLTHFGSFNFVILLLKTLFGAESVNIISRSYGSIGLEIVKPDENRFAFFVDENERYYVNIFDEHYVTIASTNIDNFTLWVISFINNFLCAGTTVTSLKITA
jgi:hypothetical protein